MKETQGFKVTGTAEDIESFVLYLQHTPQLQLIDQKWIDREADPFADTRFGKTEIIDAVLHFGVALGAHATYELVTAQFSQFRNTRRHMKIQSIERPDEGVEKGEGDSDASDGTGEEG